MALDVKVPDKFYFKIGEVSIIADVPSYVLRFWESEFSAIRPKRTSSGQRLYRKKDVELILKIKQLLYDKKFTIQGAKNYLKGKPLKNALPADKSILQEIYKELNEIRDLLL